MTTQERESTPQKGPPAGLRTKVELWVVIALMGVAFAAGTLVRSSAPKQSQIPVDTSFTQGGGAGPLTDQQLQQGLPPGHPAVSSPAAGTPKPVSSPKTSSTPSSSP